MGKHHNKMPKALVEAQKQQRLAAIHESPDETSPNKRKEAKRLEWPPSSDRIDVKSKFFLCCRARDHFPRQNGDGVHAGLDFILASNNGTALYDPTA